MSVQFPDWPRDLDSALSAGMQLVVQLYFTTYAAQDWLGIYCDSDEPHSSYSCLFIQPTWKLSNCIHFRLSCSSVGNLSTLS